MSKTSLELQSRKIAEYRSLKAPVSKRVAGLDLVILPCVYPCGTDSELLAGSVEVEPGDTALDLCTGTGVVALSMARRGALNVIGTDLNPAAIKNALKNKELLNAKSTNFIEADVFPTTRQQFDIIAINPPYTDNQAPDKTAICFWDRHNKVVRTFLKSLDIT